ncbi:hypothetical protein Dimus_031654, partial [Dionaea muscipula]
PRKESAQIDEPELEEGMKAETQEKSETLEGDVISEEDFGGDTMEKRSDSDEDLLLRDMMKEARRNLKRKRSSKAKGKPKKEKAWKDSELSGDKKYGPTSREEK